MSIRLLTLAPEDPEPATDGSGRTGRGRIERLAIRHLEHWLPTVPAPQLVRLALWPETFQGVATWAGINTVSHVTHALSNGNGVNRYRATRALLAARIGLTRAEVDEGADRPRLPFSARSKHRFPWPAGLQPAAGAGQKPPVEGVTRAYPDRDGMGALEQLALARVRENVGAFSAATVFQLLIYPFSLAELAEHLPCPVQDLYNVLNNVPRVSHGMVAPLVCRGFGVSRTNFDKLVLAERAPAVRLHAPPAPTPPAPGRRRRESP